jgi:hypothetical protein
MAIQFSETSALRGFESETRIGTRTHEYSTFGGPPLFEQSGLSSDIARVRKVPADELLLPDRRRQATGAIELSCLPKAT